MSIQNIDFLPASYRQGRLRQRKKVWHRSLLMVFLACIVAGSLQQRRTRFQLESNLAGLRQEAANLTAQLGDAGALRQRIRQLDAKANLVTLLRLRTPFTRVLASVTNPLPQYVTLTEISLKPETTAASQQPAAPTTLNQSSVTAPTKLPEEDDFDQLRKVGHTTVMCLSVNGVAPDDVAIAHYLLALQSEGLFDDVKLLYTDEHSRPDRQQRRFGLRITLRTPTDRTQERIASRPQAASPLQSGSGSEPRRSSAKPAAAPPREGSRS